jgi:hypothetical protein
MQINLISAAGMHAPLLRWVSFFRSEHVCGASASPKEPPLPRCTDYAGLTCCSTESGSVKENIEPCPTTDSTQIFPPCISMMRFEIASPSPMPPFLRVIELSAC